MADTSLNDGGFWLPSEFLTDEDILTDKENFNNNGLNSNGNLCSPTGFEYGSFGSSPFLRSPAESATESESDEDDLLSELTRQFARSTLQETYKIPYAPRRNHSEKTWGFSVSPQSTLSPVSGNGSPNGHSKGPSPPNTPLVGNGDAWNLICAVAGQMNGLKMKNEGAIKNRGLLAPTHNFTQIHPPNPTNGLYNTHLAKQQSNSIWGQQQVYQNRASTVSVENGVFVGNDRSGKALGMPEFAWPPLQVHHQYYQNQQQSGGGAGMTAAFRGGRSGGGGGGAAVERECAGTGVFLPRRYTTAPDSRRKSGPSTARLPSRVQVVHKNFENMTTQAQPHSNGGLIPDYDMLMAQRNAQFAQQRRNNMLRAEGAMNQEIRLPQEWTY